MKSNTIRYRGRTYRVLHTCNGDKSYASSIISEDTHSEKILRVIVSGEDLSTHYDLHPASIEERGILYQTYEIREKDGERPIVGYWDFPLLSEPSQPDGKVIELMERLLCTSEQMMVLDISGIVEQRYNEIINAEGDVDELAKIFGISVPPHGDGRLNWIHDEWSKKSGWNMSTNYPEVEVIIPLEQCANIKNKTLSEFEFEDVTIRKNPSLAGYYNNPITNEELEKSSCSKPTGFALRLGRRMMKKGFMRRGSSDTCYSVPDKEQSTPVLRSRYAKRIVRKSTIQSEVPVDKEVDKTGKQAVKVLTKHRKGMQSRYCRVIRRRYQCYDIAQQSALGVVSCKPFMSIGPPLNESLSESLSLHEYG